MSICSKLFAKKMSCNLFAQVCQVTLNCKYIHKIFWLLDNF